MKKFYDLIIQKFILILICSILCISAISIFTIHQRILPKINQLAKNHINTQVSDINLWFQFNREIIRQFATRFTDEELTEDNHEEILYLLTQYKNDSNIQYESLGYITLSGNKYLTDLSEFNVSDRSYFKELQDSQKDVVISDVIASKSNEEQIVLIVSKVYDKDKNVKGYISAALKTEYISNLITNIAKDFHVYITNSNGNVVLGDTKVVADGTRYEKNLISNPNWTYVLEIPSSYYMNTILETIALITIVTVLIILITLLLVQKIVTEFVSPLQRLETVMSKAKDGLLEKSNETTNIKEFYTLNSSYNTMIDEIHQLLEEVKEKEHQRNEADNRAMYAQIKPHFLYNTLETIQAMAFDHDDEDVEQAIHDLAVFFRIGLSDNRQIITLEEEIMHVKSYLNIQKLRYHDILNDEWDIDNSLLKRPFLKFTLQPLVENAIYHGVKLLNKSSTIHIRVYAENDAIAIDVCNAYHEIDQEHIRQINEALKKADIPDNNLGYGLFNVNARIKHQYGNEYGVILSAENHIFKSYMTQPGEMK